MTDQAATSGEGSPKTPMVDQTPRDTPPRSPAVESEHSGSSSSSTGPALSPLPAEVFLNVLSFLPPADLARMTRVSSAWRAVINTETQLWSTLRVALDEDADMQKVSYICRRACGNGGGRSGSGGIRNLVVRLQYCEDQVGRHVDVIPPEVVKLQLEHVLKAVAWASVRQRNQMHAVMPFGPPSTSTLRRLTLQLYPNTVATAHALHEISEWTSEPLFSALHEVDINAGLPDFVIGGDVLSIFPTVSKLGVTVPPRSRQHQRVQVGEWMWQAQKGRGGQAVKSLPSLEVLRWRSVIVLDLDLPRLPALRHLQLKDVRWVGRSFFLLLRLARRTLETIDFTNLEIKEPDDPFEDWSDFVDVRDPELIDDPVPPLDDHTIDVVPAPIRFPALRDLVIAGLTPPIFAPLAGSEVDPDIDVDAFPTPLFIMPALETCQLVETAFEEDIEYISEIGQLAALGANAPQVRHLVLNSIVVDDMAVCACLSNMGDAITHLDLSESSVSDHAVLQLPDLVSNLETLDVRLCTEISCQGVARVVEVVLTRTDSGWSKIKQVFVDPPMDSWADWRAYDWLDFVGVLGRDDLDFEGDGPADPQQRNQWKNAGKKDQYWQERLAWLQEREMKIKMLEKAAAWRAANAIGGSAAGSATTSPFFQHRDAPPHLPQQSALRLPPIPAVFAPPPAASHMSANPSQQGPRDFSVRADYQPTPVAVSQSIWQNATPQPHEVRPTRQIAEEDGDYTFLDADDGVERFDPAFREAQRAELARLSQQHDNRLVAEAEAYNAQRRRQQDATQDAAEMGTRTEEVVELHPALLVGQHAGDPEEEQVDEVLLDAEEQQRPDPRGFAGDTTDDDDEEGGEHSAPPGDACDALE